MKYVSFPHFDWFWLESSHEHHCKSKDAKYNQIQDLETRWRFLTILRKISNLERFQNVASMMYAEHVLRMRVDWSTLWQNKFGSVGDALLKCQDVDILCSPVPQWFRENPKLVDESGCPLPEGREPKRPCLIHTVENDMDMTLEEAFAIMDMDVDGEQGMESQPEAQADRRVEVGGRQRRRGGQRKRGKWTGWILLSLKQTLVQQRYTR